MPIPPEDAAFLRSQGWTDQEIANAQPQPSQAPSGQVGTLGTIGDTLRAHLGSYLGGGLGSIGGGRLGSIGGGALVGALEGSEVPLIGNIVGGIAGGLVGAYGGQKLQSAVDPNYTQAQATAQSAAQQNPITAGATDIAGSALASGGSFSPSTALRGVRSIIGKLSGGALDDAGKQVLLQAALNPAINSGLSLAQGQGLPSGTDLATQAIGGSLFAKSWLPGSHSVPDEPKTEVNNDWQQPLIGDRETPLQLVAPRRFYGNDSGIIDVDAKVEPKPEVSNSEVKLLNGPTSDEVVPPAPITTSHELLQQIIDKEATKPISVQRIFPELNLSDQEAQTMLKQAQALTKSPTTQEEPSEVEKPVNEQQPTPQGEAKTTPNPKFVNPLTGERSVVQSPLSDYNRYNELVSQLKGKSLDEATPIAKEIEEIKNRYGGKPPPQFPENRVLMPLALMQHIYSGKATTGSLLQGLANTQNHPLQELAQHLLDTADTKSLSVKWFHDQTVDRPGSPFRSHYDQLADRVNIGTGSAGNARVVMEEAIHSMTSKKLPNFTKTGSGHLQELTQYLKSGNNEHVKDLINAYLETAKSQGWHDRLFNEKVPDVYGGFRNDVGVANHADATASTGIPYAMGNLHEFIAQAFKDPSFQRLLDGIKTKDGRTVWQKIVDSVRKLLGLSPKNGSMLDRVLRSSGELIKQERPEEGGPFVNRFKSENPLLNKLQDKLAERTTFEKITPQNKSENYGQKGSYIKFNASDKESISADRGDLETALHESVHSFTHNNKEEILNNASKNLSVEDKHNLVKLVKGLGTAYKIHADALEKSLNSGHDNAGLWRSIDELTAQASTRKFWNNGESTVSKAYDILSKVYGKDFADFMRDGHITEERYYPKWDGKKFFAPPKDSETSKSPEELNLPRDKYMGKFGTMFRSVVDKIRDIGTPDAKALGDNMQRAVDRETELKGKWKNLIVQGGEHLSTFDKKKLMEVFNRELETGKSGVTMLTNQSQRAFYNLARQKLDESGKYRLAIGEPITTAVRTKNGGTIYARRDLKQDPFYFPGMANQKVLDVYRKGTDHDEMTRLDKEFHDYNTKTLGLTEEASEERVDNFKKSVQGSLQKSDISHQDYFNAHRKAQGTPLPPSFRELDPVRNLERYFDRAAVDASHYEFLEKDPRILASLGQTKDAWGNAVPPSSNVLANNAAVKAGLEHWRGEAINPAEQNESSLSSLLSSAFISGPALEVHKIVSNTVKSLSLTSNPAVLTHALVNGMGNIMKGYQHAVENGVVKLTARSASQMLSSSSTAAERLQATSRLIRRVATLNDLTTKFGAGLIQSINEVIVPSKVARANAGDVTSQLFVKRLDPTYTVGKQYSDQEMQQLALRSANYIHGTGDIRSLPAWMLNDSEFSGFFSLAHWSIAQTNNFMKDVYEPAMRGDIRPLLTGIFGAAIGGYLIKELRQDIQGKKNPIPSIQEIASSDRGLEGNKGLLAYNMIAAMQYSGFGGLLSQIAKYPFDAAYKNTPQGATFPLDEIASDMAGTLHQVQEAIANDPNVNWLDMARAVSNHILSTDFQLSRIALNQGIDKGIISGLPAEKKELSDKLGQLRRFDMVEGLPYNDIDESQNPYMNLEQKKFKMEQDIPKAVQELPTLIHGIMATYHSNPDVMMAKLKALKQNTYETFPSMEDTPLSFYKYLGYLSREEGPQASQAALVDYLRHKAVNEAKASVVP